MMKPLKILVVDDQAIIAQDLIMKVTAMGYSGCAVSSGKEALEKITHDFEPDLILMDIKLKGRENGIQTARVIQKFKKIPVLFVTAYRRSTVLKKIRDLVRTGCIQKPFGKRELQLSIRQLLAAA